MIFFIFFIVIVISLVAVASSLKSLQEKGVLKDLQLLPENLLRGNNNREIEVDGVRVQARYHPGSKNNPSSYQLSLNGNFCAHALIRRETGADKFGKQIGLNEETQLYDQNFDDAVYIECEDQDFIRQLLSASDLKRQLVSVFDDFNKLQIDGSKCLLIKSPCPNPAVLIPEKITLAAQTLAGVAARIPAPVPGKASSTPVTDQVRVSCGWLTGTGIVMAVVGIVLTLWGAIAFEPLELGQVFLLGLKIALPLFVIFVIYVYQQVKGLSSALAVFSGAFFAALIGLPLLLWGGLMVINATQDVSAAVEHPTRVVGKRITHSKNSTSYHLQVGHWIEGKSVYDFTVSHYTYNRINPGDPCTVTTRSGLFKFIWVSGKYCHRPGE